MCQEGLARRDRNAIRKGDLLLRGTGQGGEQEDERGDENNLYFRFSILYLRGSNQHSIIHPGTQAVAPIDSAREPR